MLLRADHAITTWTERCAAAPTWSALRLGQIGAAVGSIIMVAAILITPPVMYVGAGLAAIGALMARMPIHRLAVTWAGVVYGLWMMLCAAGHWWFDHVPFATMGQWYSWLAIPLIAFGLSTAVARVWALRALAGVAVVALIVAVAQFSIGLGDGPLKIVANERTRLRLAEGFAPHHLNFGYTMGLVLLVGAWALAVSRSERPAARRGERPASSPVIPAFLALSGVISMIISGSRGGAVAGIAGVAVALALRSWRWALVAVITVSVIGGAIATRMWLTDPERLGRAVSFSDGRLPIWRTTRAMIADHPLTGVGGRKQYRAVYADYYARAVPDVANEFAGDDGRGGAPDAHNVLLSLAAEFGLPAVILHLSLLATVVIMAWRTRRTHPATWSLAGGAVTAIVVGGLFENYAGHSIPGFAGFTVLGLALAMLANPKPADRVIST